MPNWTYNELKVKGNCNLRDFSFIDDDNRLNFDFSKIIPEPATQEECLEKYGYKYLDFGDKHLMHSEEDSWFDWYQWHTDFWGTKWNACDSSFVGEHTVSFSTAWTMPEPIFKKLAEMFPDCEFEIYSEFEDGGSCSQIYSNGKLESEASANY